MWRQKEIIGEGWSRQSLELDELTAQGDKVSNVMVRASRTKSNRVTSEDNLKAVKHADRQQSMHLKQKSNYFGKSFETVKHTDKTDRQDRKSNLEKSNKTAYTHENTLKQWMAYDVTSKQTFKTTWSCNCSNAHSASRCIIKTRKKWATQHYAIYGTLKVHPTTGFAYRCIAQERQKSKGRTHCKFHSELLSQRAGHPSN